MVLKNNMKAFISLLIALTMALGCAFAGETTVTELDPDAVVITFNGNPIYGKQVNEYYEYYIEYYTYQGYDMTNDSYKLEVRKIAVKNAVQMSLIAQKAVEMGLQLSEEECAAIEEAYGAEWDEAVIYYGGYSDSMTDEEKAEALAQGEAYLKSATGYTRESLINVAKTAEENNRVKEACLANTQITEDEIIAYYNGLVAEDEEMYAGNVALYEYYVNYMGYSSYYTPAGYRGIKQILLSVDSDLLSDYTTKKSTFESQEENAAETVTAEDVEAAKQAVIASIQESLDDIYTSFNNKTATFDELISKYNTDPGMNSEPYMSEGYSVHSESIMWDSAFTSAAMSIDEVGGISEPSIGSYGVYICYYLRDVPSGIMEMTDDMRAEFTETLKNNAYYTMVEEWEANADVVYSDACKAYAGLE